MSNADKHFYDVYIYKYNGVRNFAEIESDLRMLDGSVGITVQNISQKENAEKVSFIDAAIMNERFRVYNPSREKSAYVHLVEYTQDRYLLIISYHPAQDNECSIASILETVTHQNTYTHISFGQPAKDCIDYWKHKLSFLTLTTGKDYETTYVSNKEESFPITVSNSAEFTRLIQENPRRIKAYFSDCLGKALCNMTDSGAVLGEDTQDGGYLSAIPIYVSDRISKDVPESLYSYLRDAEKYSNIPYDELKKQSKIDLAVSTLYSQTFFYQRNYEEFFRKMKTDVTYKIERVEFNNSPLHVLFHLNCDHPGIQYIYDSGFFKGTSIEGFHNAICQLFNNALNDTFVLIDYKKHFTSENINAEKMIEAKAALLKNTGWFTSYSPTELFRLAESFRLSRRYSQQTIINMDKAADQLYFTVKGKVIMAGHDLSNFLQTLMIIKENDAFGIECLLDNSVSSIDYIVQSDEAILLSISAADFKSEIKQHPELMQNILTVQTNRLTKFQKLWALS